MSKLITHISRQAAFSFPGPPESVESQAFYHIATLLMQGSADKGYARDVIAVTGVQQQMGTSFTSPGLDKPAQAPSSPDINDRLVEIHITIAQNQSTESSSDGHTVFPVRASTTPVDAILEAARQEIPVSMEQHTADIFKCLKSTEKLHRTAPGSRYFEASYMALSVIIARCFPKISRRVEAVKHLFRSRFLERLLEKELDLSGELEVNSPRQVQVLQDGGCRYIEVGAKLEALFTSNGVASKTLDGVTYFLFDTSSVMCWNSGSCASMCNAPDTRIKVHLLFFRAFHLYSHLFHTLQYI